MAIRNCCSYFDPCSKQFGDINKRFKTLNGCQKLLVVLATAFAGIASAFMGGLGGLAMYRILVRNYSRPLSEDSSSAHLTSHRADRLRGLTFGNSLLDPQQPFGSTFGRPYSSSAVSSSSSASYTPYTYGSSSNSSLYASSSSSYSSSSAYSPSSTTSSRPLDDPYFGYSLDDMIPSMPKQSDEEAQAELAREEAQKKQEQAQKIATLEEQAQRNREALAKKHIELDQKRKEREETRKLEKAKSDAEFQAKQAKERAQFEAELAKEEAQKKQENAQKVAAIHAEAQRNRAAFKQQHAELDQREKVHPEQQPQREVQFQNLFNKAQAPNKTFQYSDEITKNNKEMAMLSLDLIPEENEERIATMQARMTVLQARNEELRKLMFADAGSK